MENDVLFQIKLNIPVGPVKTTATHSVDGFSSLLVCRAPRP